MKALLLPSPCTIYDIVSKEPLKCNLQPLFHFTWLYLYVQCSQFLFDTLFVCFPLRIWYQVFGSLNYKCCWALLDVIKVDANMTS